MALRPSAGIDALVDLAPAYWRILVSRVPRVAADRLAWDIRSGRFAAAGLQARARDLYAHWRPDIRDRARTEFFVALGLGHDGVEPSAHVD
jgi:hypothetical protein